MYQFAEPKRDMGLITEPGYRALHAELDHLREVERPAVNEQVRQARSDGGLPDNPGLLDAMEAQARLEHRIATLTARAAQCRIVVADEPGTAQVGTHVVALDLDSHVEFSFELVGPFEADADLGRVSVASPIGAAVMGLGIGDVGVADTPRGSRRMRLVQVTPVAA